MNRELLERFFRKQCTAEEAKEIAAYLKANQFVLEEYLSTHDWNNTVPSDAMPAEFWNEVWQNIQKKNKAKTVALKIKRIAVAACIILFAGAVYFYFRPAINYAQPLAKAYKRENTLPQIQQKTVMNNTEKTMQVMLEDGSAVELSKASFIKYDFPFQSNKREIIVEGEAKFHVAKNRQKPFIVYAGALATTALGTVFSVKKTNNKNIISVKLYEGKVVVHSTDSTLNGWRKDVYLQPGEQLKFNEVSALFAVEKINNKKPAVTAKINNQANDSVNNSQLYFNNTLLPEVLNKLSAYYNVQIRFDSALIDSMNFTGTISRNDSPEIILKAIAQMNGLNILKQNNEFIISKHLQ